MKVAEPVPTAAELDAASWTIREAFAEDLDETGDLTSQLLIPEDWQGTVEISVRKAGVVSGLPFANMVFQTLDENIQVDVLTEDGTLVSPGTVIAKVRGPVRQLLTGERTALNLLTMLSGTATLTYQFAKRALGTKAVILDTRKTLPGLRLLQKYAVRCGGGTNHRLGLYDGILIKDNHLAAWKKQGGKSLADLLTDLRQRVPEGSVLEIEVDTLEQLEQALHGQPDIVLCDNMPPELLQLAVKIRDRLAPAVQLEASGGVDLKTIEIIARTGVDRISIGALTHSAPALDIGFDWPEM